MRRRRRRRRIAIKECCNWKCVCVCASGFVEGKVKNRSMEEKRINVGKSIDFSPFFHNFSSI